jgi:hypothetical protein
MADQPIAGHVFVVKGDVTKIKCDAWLCPTDVNFSVTAIFGPALGYPGRKKLTGHCWDGRNAVPYNPAVTPPGARTKGTRATPLIVLGNVGMNTPRSDRQIQSHVEELLPVVTDFVRVAKGEVTPPENQPLRLALPLIGTGRGGLAGAKGDVVKPLLQRLNRLALQEGVDFVLCTVRDVDWSAVQSVRHQREWNLTAQEERWAQDLANKARTKSLVLFVGAGVGLDAGLPTWDQLLDKLCPKEMPKEDRDILSRLDHRDFATLIERQIGGPRKLLERLREILGGRDHFGLTHGLLASLGVEQSITTNYDDLFERAHQSPLRPNERHITVLPFDRVKEGQPWLLKLHGSIEHDIEATIGRGSRAKPSIVLTRSDYMTLARERSALFGIVQALLVTKHLLFVGYSLNDDNFHQLVDEIRLAIGSGSREKSRMLGTVLTVEKWPMADAWSDILNIRDLIGSKGPVGRHQLIFLDRLAHLATPDDAYLLDDDFQNLLKPGERKVAARLAGVQSTVKEILSKDPTNKTGLAVMKALKHFGAR